MAQTINTAEAGEVNDLTAGLGSFPVCDACGCADELKEWESDNGSLYRYCKVCWFDIEDTVDELRALQLEPPVHDGGCDDCGSPTALTSEFWHNDGRTIHLCENCYQSADHSDDYMEPLPKRQELQCADCMKKPATKTFAHLDGRKFNLCDYCFQLADHEEDYGAEFGSTPNLRKNGPAKLCDCPLPCAFLSPTRCELCKGIVIDFSE